MTTDSVDASFHFRRFAAAADISRLVYLLQEVEAADHSGQDISEEIARDQLILPGHDPLLDRWVVEAPDDQNQIIAYSSSWKTLGSDHADCEIVVHPTWRRRGIGSELLTRTIARAKEQYASYLILYADVSHLAANDFLLQYGFTSNSAYTHMRINADIPLNTLITPVWPSGYEVRSYDTVQHLPTLCNAFNRCYEGLLGHHKVIEEELEGWLPLLPLDGVFLLFAPVEEVVGLCRAEFSEQLSALRGRRTGYVDSPGIVPGYRGEGLYLPLLLTAMQWIRAKESVDIELESWGDDSRTLELYQEIGFAITRQETIYRWDLR